MIAAPAFVCSQCGRLMGKTRTHYLLTDEQVACARCVNRGNGDEVICGGTRAGIAARLGLWPQPDGETAS